ncbi:MAG: universal stress protein [Acidobacteria bacterium]|nr:universal stress protein [Acidobacteriota bacterium]
MATTMLDPAHLETTPVSFRRILVTTDFSAQAHMALVDAVRLAMLFAGEIFVLHALPPMDVRYGDVLGMETRQAAMAAAQTAMAREVESIRDLARIPCMTRVEEGPLDLQVEQVVRSHHIDLVVAGSRGAQGLDKLLFGSSAESLIRRAPCPVLIVGPNARRVDSLQSILFAADLELGSLRAAQYAAALAKTMQATLTVMHVVNRVGPPQRELRKDLEERLMHLLPRDAAMYFKAHVQVDHGLPAPRILRAANLGGTELILTGCRHNGALGDHAAWRTLSKLIHDAACPVLVVNGRLGEGAPA